MADKMDIVALELEILTAKSNHNRPLSLLQICVMSESSSLSAVEKLISLVLQSPHLRQIYKIWRENIHLPLVAPDFHLALSVLGFDGKASKDKQLSLIEMASRIAAKIPQEIEAAIQGDAWEESDSRSSGGLEDVTMGRSIVDEADWLIEIQYLRSWKPR